MFVVNEAIAALKLSHEHLPAPVLNLYAHRPTLLYCTKDITILMETTSSIRALYKCHQYR